MNISVLLTSYSEMSSEFLTTIQKVQNFLSVSFLKISSFLELFFLFLYRLPLMKILLFYKFFMRQKKLLFLFKHKHNFVFEDWIWFIQLCENLFGEMLHSIS